MRIAITGAYSYTGKYATRRLLARGDDVVTLTNHPNRLDPFAGKVRAQPLVFSNASQLEEALRGAEVLVNTYWIRFDQGPNTQPQAVENTKKLVAAAVCAGVKRIVHISITNPSASSALPYFWGKAANEKAVIDSGLSYAILRPTVLFGREDILINNIAWLLRHFPIFFLPGDGSCRLAPVYVDDLAALVEQSVHRTDSYVWDAVGPDTFSFKEMVELIGDAIEVQRPLLPVGPRLALLTAKLIGSLVRDVVLTPEEVQGLLANLLISNEPPRCHTSLRDWLAENHATTGAKYASELQRHYTAAAL